MILEECASNRDVYHMVINVNITINIYIVNITKQSHK